MVHLTIDRKWISVNKEMPEMLGDGQYFSIDVLCLSGQDRIVGYYSRVTESWWNSYNGRPIPDSPNGISVTHWRRILHMQKCEEDNG